MTPASVTAVILIHAASTWAMVGVIWFVQVVHYPLFASVTPDDPLAFAAYEKQHTTLTGFVVAPLMFAELFASIGLLLLMPTGVSRWLLWAGAATVAINWGSTWLLQVPQHGKLTAGFDATAHATLVNTNWIRTFAWTAHGLIAAAIVWQWANRPTLAA